MISIWTGRRLGGLGALVLCGGLWMASGSALCAGEPPKENMTAPEILSAMAKVYAGAGSYRDAGEVTTVFFESTGKRTVKKPFKTAFVRPDRFRFEFQERFGEEEWRRMIVWRQGDKVQSWWDLRPGVEHPSSLGYGLAAATGVSDRSAHTIPHLLLPDQIEGWSVINLTQPKRLADASFDGADCFRIEGQQRDDPMTLWIDKASFLVRRIDTRTQFSDFRTESSTIYRPEIGAEIPAQDLEFRSEAPARR